MDIRYYVNSGMSVIHDGNHRMAGYKLAGYTNFPMDKVIVYNDIFDKRLNDSLFILENQFYELPVNFRIVLNYFNIIILHSRDHSKPLLKHNLDDHLNFAF